MATIIRNGQQIELTEEEIRQIRDEEHRKDIRYEVEEALRLAEENEDISFDSWQECPCADYDSQDDAREDFINEIIDSILKEEESREYYAPDGYCYCPDFDSKVIDTAEEFGYLKGE